MQHIYPGARIKLRHVLTGKHLHSHEFRPPVSDVDFQNEVSAYGMHGFEGDNNDDWVVEIDKGHKKDKHSSKRIRTIRTQFRLRHMITGCYLFSHKVKLPEWGFEQQEVTCNKNAVRPNSLWYVETATHPKCKSLPLLMERMWLIFFFLPAFQCRLMQKKSTTNCLAFLANSLSSNKLCGPQMLVLPTAMCLIQGLIVGHTFVVEL